MALSNSRQQFLAYESQGSDNLRYDKKAGVLVSTCICAGFVICAVLLCAIVGIIVHFITFYKMSQKEKDFWDEQNPFQSSGEPALDLRLPTDVVPSFYRLKLVTDIDNSNFSGDVYITLRANKRVKKIILHSKNLKINQNVTLKEQIYETVHTSNRSKRIKRTIQGTTVIPDLTQVNMSAENVVNVAPDSNAETTTVGQDHTVTAKPITTTTTSILNSNTQVTHSSVKNVKILLMSLNEGDRVTFTLETALKTDVDYTLQISFSGKISNSLTGFYKSNYQNSKQETKTVAVTQFEPISARMAFPCFDEPEFKAQFEISIAHRDNYTALSNMKVSAEEPIPDKPGWKWTHFDRSVKMSTYLIAYILSDFKSQETSYLSRDNVTKPIRIWTRPELISKTKYALSIAPKLLEYYEVIFGLPYALDKVDMVAIPEFSNGAMENWGLITFRETSLIFDEETSVARDKMTVAISIAHELAHQWFGNLVTMKWWTDLWLNEGFATFIEYVGVDHIEPTWNMLEAFSRDKMDLLRSDALKNTSPVSRRVVDASEISQKFDEISYVKGANLIRMLNCTISEGRFREGLVYYLNQWKYTNAQENDLWQAMATASRGDPALEGRSLVEFMNSWTRQAGYPVVTVTRNYHSGEVKFEQKLFTSSNNPYKSVENELWQIPVSYTQVEAPHEVWGWGWRPDKWLWLTSQALTQKLPLTDNQPLYVNINAIGYYRVNYDQKNWELLGNALKSGIITSPVTRAQLLDDAFNLAKANQLNYSLALDLSTFMIDSDNSKLVWDLFLNNMAFLRLNLKTTSGFSYFQDYMKILLQKHLEKFNYGLKTPSNDNEALLMENLVTWECYVESERCLSWARTQFEKWMLQPQAVNNWVPKQLRSVVLSTAVRRGGRREWEAVWRAFSSSARPAIKTLLVSTLPLTTHHNLITMLLEKSLTAEMSPQLAASVWNVESPVGTAVAQRFLVSNFAAVSTHFNNIDAFMMPNVLSGAFGLITSEQELKEFKTFAKQHKDELMPMSQTLQKIVDTATLRIDWIKRHAHTINNWFREYVEKHGPLQPMASSGA